MSPFSHSNRLYVIDQDSQSSRDDNNKRQRHTNDAEPMVFIDLTDSVGMNTAAD